MRYVCMVWRDNFNYTLDNINYRGKDWNAWNIDDHNRVLNIHDIIIYVVQVIMIRLVFTLDVF